MSLNLNPNFPTYRDKVGQYVEVLGVVGNKIVLTYPEENIDTVESSLASTLKVGQRLYFNDEGVYDPKLKPTNTEVAPTFSNKQSPLKLPKDINSRY